MSFENPSEQQKPEERVHQVKLPEGAPQQEFFATEAGTVAGRDNLEHLQAEADGMLADREKSVATIESTLQEALREAQKELILRRGVRERDIESFKENPDGFNAEFKVGQEEQFEKEVKEIGVRIETLSDITQKLERGTLSPEDAKLLVEYLPRDNRIVTQMFLTRLNNEQRKQQEKNIESEVRKLSPDDLRLAADQESSLLYEAMDRARTDGERQQYAKKIDFYSNISSEIERFSVWQKDNPNADWDDYLAS